MNQEQTDEELPGIEVRPEDIAPTEDYFLEASNRAYPARQSENDVTLADK